MSIDIPIISSFSDGGIKSAIKSFQQLETSSQKAQFAIKKAALPAAAALAGLAAAGYQTAKAASDFNETINKSKVIFGNASAGIEKFAESAAKNIGQSKQEAVDAAATFGIFGKAAGKTGEDLAKFSVDLVKLSSDVASFNNAKPAEVALAFGAALRGEAEPVRRFGVLLNDAAIKAEAMRLGIFEGSGALSAQQKVLAVQSLLIKQTSDAQGDFARTSEGAANQQRILEATIKDLKVDLGQAFLPILEKVLPKLVTFASWAADNTPIILGVASAVGVLSAAIVALRIAMAVQAAAAFLAAAGITAVQIATGIGIIAVVAGTAAFAAYKIAMKDSKDEADKAAKGLGVLTDATNTLAIATTTAALTQAELNSYMGPVASRNVNDYANGVLKASFITELLAKAAKKKAEGDANSAASTTAATEAETKHAEAIAAKKKVIEDYLTAYKGYADSISGTITGLASLSAAQSKSAESGGKIGIGQAFYKQVAQAKHFARNLKRLITDFGLSQAGVSQLLNLGPEAGLAVTDDMILGVGDLTVGGLNNALQGLSDVSAGLGGAAAGKFMTKGNGGNSVNITVNAGVGDPVAIGKSVVDALTAYKARTGSLAGVLGF